MGMAAVCTIAVEQEVLGLTENSAAAPASASTTTSLKPCFSSVCTTVGVTATRRSPSALSLGTPEHVGKQHSQHTRARAGSPKCRSRGAKMGQNTLAGILYTHLTCVGSNSRQQPLYTDKQQLPGQAPCESTTSVYCIQGNGVVLHLGQLHNAPIVSSL